MLVGCSLPVRDKVGSQPLSVTYKRPALPHYYTLLSVPRAEPPSLTCISRTSFPCCCTALPLPRTSLAATLRIQAKSCVFRVPCSARSLRGYRGSSGQAQPAPKSGGVGKVRGKSHLRTCAKPAEISSEGLPTPFQPPNIEKVVYFAPKSWPRQGFRGPFSRQPKNHNPMFGPYRYLPGSLFGAFCRLPQNHRSNPLSGVQKWGRPFFAQMRKKA